MKVKMLGYDPTDFKHAGYQAYTSLLHPEDYERAMQAMRGHLEGENDLYQVDYRIKKADGTYTWYMDRGVIIERTKTGAPLRLRGLVMDLGPALREQAKNETALARIRKLLPGGKRKEVLKICAECKKFKMGDREWVKVDENFLKVVSEDISHGICPECIRKLYPELADDLPA